MKKQCVLQFPAIVVLMCSLYSCMAGGKYAEPVTTGMGESSIEIVFHPGASAFPTRMVEKLGNELAFRNNTVTIVNITKNPGYFLDKQRYDALVIISPVYGATTMQPVREFLKVNAPFSMPVFALLTGFFASTGKNKDISILEGFLAELNSNLTAGIKIGTAAGSATIDSQIKSLCNSIGQAISIE
ncbi:MAG: hypothetical protein JXB88_17525 [Spirochaetales bacterium]|nr:hypothetical protein [Spirochaetales bacterium]